MANKKITDLMSGTPVRDSLLESAIDISGTMDSRKVKAGAVADLANANVASPYDDTVTYAIGQYCLYEGDIYRCIAITTGAFDSTKWTQIVVTGEFRRVVELTSAQYTALSSAEKNNGTLYVLTDEETTAADIPYSSGVSVADKLDNVPSFDTLTTSDNNKLLGVSVSGSDISVGAVALSAIKSNMILGNFAVYSAERILNNATKSIPLTQNLFVLFFKSYAQAGCYGAYLISYHPSVQSSQYISTLAKGNSNMPTLSISGSNLVIATGGTDIYYSMLRLN